MMNLTPPTYSGNVSTSVLDWSCIDLLWTLAFSTIVITSIVGNCLVIWIVTGWYISCLEELGSYKLVNIFYVCTIYLIG